MSLGVCTSATRMPAPSAWTVPLGRKWQSPAFTGIDLISSFDGAASISRFELLARDVRAAGL